MIYHIPRIAVWYIIMNMRMEFGLSLPPLSIDGITLMVRSIALAPQKQLISALLFSKNLTTQ